AARLRIAQQVALALVVALALERPYRAAREGFRLVRHDEPRVDAHRAAEPAAGLARADRRVEREAVRDRRREIDVAIRARQRRREPKHATGGDGAPGNAPAAVRDRALERLAEPRAVPGLQHEPVLHDLDAGRAPPVDPRETLAREERLDLLGAEVVRHRHRERDVEPRAGRDLPLELAARALRIVAAHAPAAARAVERRRAREQQLQVIVQDRKSTRLNSSHVKISYAVLCLKKTNWAGAATGARRRGLPALALFRLSRSAVCLLSSQSSPPGHPGVLHSFPTRRSSDLAGRDLPLELAARALRIVAAHAPAAARAVERRRAREQQLQVIV